MSVYDQCFYLLIASTTPAKEREKVGPTTLSVTF